MKYIEPAFLSSLRNQIFHAVILFLLALFLRFYLRLKRVIISTVASAAA
jgi:hypothetical protein